MGERRPEERRARPRHCSLGVSPARDPQAGAQEGLRDQVLSGT